MLANLKRTIVAFCLVVGLFLAYRVTAVPLLEPEAEQPDEKMAVTPGLPVRKSPFRKPMNGSSCMPVSFRPTLGRCKIRSCWRATVARS